MGRVIVTEVRVLVGGRTDRPEIVWQLLAGDVEHVSPRKSGRWCAGSLKRSEVAESLTDSIIETLLERGHVV